MRNLRTVFLLSALAACAAPGCLAQESASYKLHEHALNAGGVPAQGQEHVSASFRVTLESIAGPVGQLYAGSAGYGAQGGFVPGLAPATEVEHLRFADGDTLNWDGNLAAGTYRVYRDALDGVGAALGSCLAGGLGGPTADDATDPVPGAGFAYLVTVANTLGEEGTAGAASSGVERALVAPCP